MPKVVYIHIYDIGGEFEARDIGEIAKSLGEPRKEKTSDIYTDYFIELGMSPVRALVKEMDAGFMDKQGRLSVYVKLMGLGVVLVEFVFDFETPISSAALMALTWTDTLTVGGEAVKLTDISRELFNKCVETSKPFIEKVYSTPDFVDIYRIVVEEEPRPGREITGILLNEEKSVLSKSLVKRLEENTVSYSKDDKVVFTAISSYVVSKTYPEDVINIIELARIQLFELRVYDVILDKRIDRAYSLLEEVPKAKGFLTLRPFSREHGKLSEIALEIRGIRMDLMDTVTDILNSTKVTNDIYLAYLYRHVSEEFRVGEWHEGVRLKINELEDLYSMAIDRLEMLRSYTLEFLIFALILLELIFFIVIGT